MLASHGSIKLIKRLVGPWRPSVIPFSTCDSDVFEVARGAGTCLLFFLSLFLTFFPVCVSLSVQHVPRPSPRVWVILCCGWVWSVRVRFRRNSSSCITGSPGLSNISQCTCVFRVLKIDTELLITFYVWAKYLMCFQLFYHAGLWCLVNRAESSIFYEKET